MNATIAIDKAGRLIVPKQMRDALHLKAGELLDIEQEDGQLVLRPHRPEAELVKKDGMWVIIGGTGELSAVDLVDLIDQDREERIQYLMRAGADEDDGE
jgi:AbrB family looped-hinge helix DNA binding protein